MLGTDHDISLPYTVLMEPLLLFSLFIAHLAVGAQGGLLQYSTDDIIYVSADGIDDSSCLNGDGHCKTLGYVLTNIPMLQCSNCTVMVRYDHVVGSLNNTLYYTVNISNVEALHIIGVGQPSLYFNGSGLRLVNNDNTTTVIMKNLELNDCRFNINQIECCIATNGIYYYLQSFIISNVILHNAAVIRVTAKGVYSQGSSFYNLSNGGLWLYLVDSDIVVTNCTFEGVRGNAAIHIVQNYSHYCMQENCINSILIKHSCFFDIIAKSAIFSEITGSVNFTVDGCVMHNSKSEFVRCGPVSSIRGNFSMVNNCIVNNTCDACVSMAYTDKDLYSLDTYRSICQNNLTIKIDNNTFLRNNGNVLNFLNWAHLEISNTVLVNNTVIDYAISIKHKGTIQCHQSAANIFLHDLEIFNNAFASFPVGDRKKAITILQYQKYSVTLSFLNFTKNKGAPLSIVSTDLVHVNGTITFYENYAVRGGGMYIDNSTISIAHKATIFFTRNVALYGGAIYVFQNDCFINISNYHKNSIVFMKNHANYGPSIFSYYDWCHFNDKPGCASLGNTDIVSFPTKISFNNDNSTSIFPGQTIIGDMILTDCFGKHRSYLADAFLLCNGKLCEDYNLEGPSSLYIYNGTINTGLTVSAAFEHKTTIVHPELKLVCRPEIFPLTLSINITVSSCPLGFIFINETGQCECAMEPYFICNKDIGQACVREGYWYSGTSGRISQCIHLLFCDYSNKRQCPSEVSTHSVIKYVLLGVSQDDQCFDGHGGTLCAGCAHNKLPTYGALQCIDSDRCASWHPYVLLLLNIVIPFIYGVGLIAVIKLKLSIGSGYMYGPLFYLAALSLIPLPSHSILNTIVSSSVATLLLKLNILGYVPWCFFTASLLTAKWFDLIAPSVVGIVLVLTVYLARCSPKLLEHFQKSPLQTMCLLMYVSFWSLASTAISVIIPVYLSGVEGARVHLQPDLAYLSGGHIPLWIASVMILLVLYSVVIVLTLSRFLNLHRFKPVFDELQSCYRDSYRWYGGVYFIIWTILLLSIVTSSYRIFQTSVIALTVAHCLLQPYSNKWLNRMDGFLFGSLSITACLLFEDVHSYLSNSKLSTVIVYMSVLGPLCLISLGIISIVLFRFKTASSLVSIVTTLRRLILKIKVSSTTPCDQPGPLDISVNVASHSLECSADKYREPLLYYAQDSGCDYSAL